MSRSSFSFRLRQMALFVLCLGLVGVVAVRPAMATAVVEQVPGKASDELGRALQRLSANPKSVPALIDAGRAALTLDDINSAKQFFDRAYAVSPKDGRVLVGLALVSLRQADPVDALDYFYRAGQAGENLAPYDAERGLAQDLVGNNAQAQRLYDIALSQNRNDETIRRLSLSYAISGNQAASESTLLPLLEKRNLAAYRTRAFALAILGKQKQAISIVKAVLPKRIAHNLIPFMRQMPRLTHAQQAAAANLGRFPPASQIGHDSPRLVAAARLAAARFNPLEGRSSTSLAVAGGTRPAGAGATQDRRDSSGELPPVHGSGGRQQLPPAPPPRSNRPTPIAVSDAGAAPSPVRNPAPQPSATPAQRPQPSIRQAFSDLARENPRPSVKPRSGAVNMAKIKPTRAKPKPPPVPSRYWVQVASGRRLHAFPFTWKRLVRRSHGLLRHKRPYYVRYGRSYRLLTGPFRSASSAQRFVNELRRKGIRTLRFKSDRGQRVDRLR